MENEKKFTVEFLSEARQFLADLDVLTRDKVIYNLRKAQVTNNTKVFKKLRNDIWEFRTSYGGLQYRLLAFWDKRKPHQSLVIATHGFVKKTDEVPAKKIEKASQIKKQYFATE